MKLNFKALKIFLIIISICFMLPSSVYILKNGTTLNFNGNLEFQFLLTENIDRLYQAMIYSAIIITFIFCFYLIIKHREKLFKSINQIYSFILIIAIIFVFVIPFWCSDVFYYLGIGRLASKYNQNPYYVDMKTYIDDNNIDIHTDTVMQKGYNNYWSNTTVVYGAFWTMICSAVSFLSLGNVDIGLLIFKFVNLAIHMGNCYLIYKISRKKIFTLIYGINPFILIEGIANAHNDMFVAFFMLLSIYFIYRKKKLTLGLISLALATDIKYFSVLLLPFLLIYHFKDYDVKNRIIRCMGFGILFLIFVLVPYIPYFRDANVFIGPFTQNEKLAKGIYLVISEFFTKPDGLVNIIKNLSLVVFTMLYIITCIVFIMIPKIRFNKMMTEFFRFSTAFLFLLITNFQPWYFIWLVPVMVWQKSENIKLIVQMQLMTLIANIVFLVYSENYKYGVPYFVIFVFGIMICIIQNKKSRIRRLQK